MSDTPKPKVKSAFENLVSRNPYTYTPEERKYYDEDTAAYKAKIAEDMKAKKAKEEAKREAEEAKAKAPKRDWQAELDAKLAALKAKEVKSPQSKQDQSPYDRTKAFVEAQEQQKNTPKEYKKGGAVKSRGDGIAKRGKTKGKMR